MKGGYVITHQQILNVKITMMLKMHAIAKRTELLEVYVYFF
jgi:hypothetical protein